MIHPNAKINVLVSQTPLLNEDFFLYLENALKLGFRKRQIVHISAPPFKLKLQIRCSQEAQIKQAHPQIPFPRRPFHHRGRH